MNLHTWLAHAAAAHPDRDVADLESRYLAAHITGLSPTAQRIHNPELTAAQQQALDALATRLHSGEPLAYLLGQQPFYGLDLKVSRATLIPRSDSEILVERALHHLRDLTAPVVFDLGTGSGALALAIAAARPDARITSTDQSAEALAIAAENARRHRLHNVTFRQADWLAPFAADSADLILSNPPYIAPDDPHLAALAHEPQSALVAAADGYRDLYTILAQAPRVLKTNGWLLMEHGWQQGETLRTRAAASGDWQHIATHRDYAGRERMSEMQKRGDVAGLHTG